MSDKELLYQALKKRNCFEFYKTDSLQILKTEESLDDLVIQVERSCNTDRLFFRYDPQEKIFYRIALTQEDFDLLDSETHCIALPQCRVRKCLSREIKLSDFLNLLNSQFEAIAIYKNEADAVKN